MKYHVLSLLIVLVCSATGTRALAAATPTTSVETRLRERLQATMVQLRAAEADRAALQAAHAQCPEEKKAMTQRIEALVKEVNTQRLALKELDELRAQIASKEKELARLKEQMDQQRRAAESAIQKETARAQQAEETVAELQRLLGERQAKNLELYKTACEILQRYEKFSLGDALAAREPFVGLTRVKLQNLVQDYRDKLSSQRTTLTEDDLMERRKTAQTSPPQKTQ